MTIREYINENYKDIESYANIGLYDKCSKIFFPNKNDIPTNLLTIVNFEPFNYSEENGGTFASFVTNYILSNYIDNDLNYRFLSINSGISSLQNQVMLLMCKYKYKWQALYKSTTIDDEYNILDNVNEIYDETVTRTPNITHEKVGQSVYGATSTDTTNNYGAKSSTETNNIGSINNTDTEKIGAIDTNNETIHGLQNTTATNNIGAVNNEDINNVGAKEDVKTLVHGELSNTTNTTDSTYPFEDNNDPCKTNNSVTSSNTAQYTDTETNKVGAQINSNTHKEQAKTDTLNTQIDSFTDTNHETTNERTNTLTHVENERVNTSSISNNEYKDTQSVSTLEHVDNSNETIKENGNETTVYSRKRHGNIGVTTSGQLIEDFRNTHYFDIIKIVGNDIANEIINLCWRY